MAGQLVHRLIFLMSSPRLEQRTLAHYNTFLEYLFVINLSDCGDISRLNAELNPIRQLLALVGAHHIVHVSRARVKGAGRCRVIFVSCRLA